MSDQSRHAVAGVALVKDALTVARDRDPVEDNASDYNEAIAHIGKAITALERCS